MATHHGQITEFSGNSDDWEAYVEQLENYFEANEIESAAKKRAILLSSCGTAAYKTIRSILAPKKPTEVEYAELVRQVKQHYAPKPSEIIQRYKFYTCNRQPSESIADYVARLRALTEYCEFGETLNSMLRDRLVCGVNNEQLQRRLLAEPRLTFEKALELSRTFESATEDARSLQREPKSAALPVNALSQKGDTLELPPAANKPCYRCGGNHRADTCKFKQAMCHKCNKKGHIAKVCRSSQSKPPSNRQGQPPRNSSLHQILQAQEALEDDSTDEVYALYNLPGSRTKPIQTIVSIGNQDLLMEVDTGASLSIISEKTYSSLNNAPQLQSTEARLRTYTGESLPVLGSITVPVHHNHQQKILPLLVVRGEGPSLLGRDWLEHLQLDWAAIHKICSGEDVQAVLDRHAEVFKEELGTLRGTKVKLHVDPSVQPKACKPRRVPFSVKQKVEVELQRLQEESVIEPVQFSHWATPIVPIAKQDGTVRICGDYKATLNRALRSEVYPLPRIEELFTALAGGEQFSKLDLSHAYQQLVLEDDSQMLTTITTHKGLFKYNRLPFGVTTAPSVFQRIMENLLQGLQYVTVYLDDILVTGSSRAEHLATLEEVLIRFEKAGMRLKKSKCKFMLSEIEYLGHVISKDGLKPSDAKVRAISQAPIPTNLSELKAFLGLVNYYGKFLPQLSTTLAPLHKLLATANRFQWGNSQQNAFDQVKRQLVSSELLVHYDSESDLVLACDASPYGVGAVLSHRFSTGQERPIAYASRTLAPAEKRYCHLDKEALAIIFGLKKFHQYLYGRKFAIYTDHKPLSYLFDSTRTVPQLASARLQRWALTLSAYSYSIEYKAGRSNGNADALSRLPLPDIPAEIPMPADTIFLLEHLNNTPVTANMIKRWTNQDPVLAKVKNLVLQGWPASVTDEDIRPYFNKQNELSIEGGCVLRGTRVVVPPQGRKQVLELLHDTHPGMERMKRLARSYVWWPALDTEIEEKVKSCHACQSSRNRPEVAPLHPFEWPSKPWSRIHVDYAGPFMNRMFLIIVDAHTKWLDVHVTSSSTAAVTIEKLQRTFATFGLPETVVSDNGSSFTSHEFADFMRVNGISHVRTSPYHPSSNGLAERAVQTFKMAMKRMTKGTIESRVSSFLFKYRVTPHSTTGVPPAELMFNRRLRGHLDLLQPNIGQTVRQNQSKQKMYHDTHSRTRDFKEGDAVYVCSFDGTGKWLPGIITAKQGPLSFRVTLDDDRVVRRHIDHVRSRMSTDIPTEAVSSVSNDVLPFPMDNDPVQHSEPVISESDTVRRSSRISRPPTRLIEEIDI